MMLRYIANANTSLTEIRAIEPTSGVTKLFTCEANTQTGLRSRESWSKKCPTTRRTIHQKRAQFMLHFLSAKILSISTWKRQMREMKPLLYRMAYRSFFFSRGWLTNFIFLQVPQFMLTLRILGSGTLKSRPPRQPIFVGERKKNSAKDPKRPVFCPRSYANP